MFENIETIKIVSDKDSVKTFILKEYFEKNSEEIKNEIILFISKIKKKKINDLELRKFLSFDNDFSIWDISLINEKNVYKSDCILNLTKFIAIKKILKKNFTKKIILQNFDKKFIQKLKKTSIYKNYKFELGSLKKTKINFKEKILLKINNSVLLSILYFLFFCFKNLSNKNLKDVKKIKKKKIIFNYFTQYDQKKLEKGIFCPKQWPDITYKLNNILWINIFLPNKKFGNIHQINSFIKKKEINNIFFINNFFEYNILLKVFKTFFISLYKFYFFIRKFKFDKGNYNDNLIFLKDDIKKSLCCFHLFQNLAYHFLIQNILKKTNKSVNEIFYLFENQPWEKSLIFASRNLKIQNIYAYSHTTINYWHLNYFNTNNDNKNFLKNNFPEIILCHSENCRKHLLSQGYKSNQLIKVSAERFRWATKIKKKNFDKKKTRILVIGDYEKKINSNLIKEINYFMNKDLNNLRYSVTYKPHPSTFYDLNFLSKKINITRKNLNRILGEYEIILSTNSTATSAEASLTNKKILIFIDYSNLDLSPFKLKNKFKNYFNFFDHNDLNKLITSKNKKINKYNFYFKKKYRNNWQKLFNSF